MTENDSTSKLLQQTEQNASPSTSGNPTISVQPATNSRSHTPRSRKSTLKSKTQPNINQEPDDTTWGSNFWVTLVDPQSQTAFFACPATGEVSWEPPVGTFVLPPSEEGEWWELGDDSRGGLPYYYQTKTGETVWERPGGFVIPLSILQSNSMDRRLSQSTFDHFSKLLSSKSQQNKHLSLLQHGHAQNANGTKSVAKNPTGGEYSSRPRYPSNSKRHNMISVQLTPIPGSPNATEKSSPSSLASKSSLVFDRENTNGKLTIPKDSDSPKRSSKHNSTFNSDSLSRARSSKPAATRPHLSLQAAIEEMTASHYANSHIPIPKSAEEHSISESTLDEYPSPSQTPVQSTPPKRTRNIPPSPSRPVPVTPKQQPTVDGKGISAPILNPAATLELSPVKNRATGRPIFIESNRAAMPGASLTTLPSGTYPILPQALAEDIQQFSESAYAAQYFSIHRKGFIFRRKVPVAQLMTWQKGPLTEPLLNLKRPLHKNAVKLFKVIQHIMGDREREKPVNIKLQPDTHISMINALNASTTSLTASAANILEEERWLLTEGLGHGELRDEIYCQIMKQLTGNPNKESVFKGWQLLCVILMTFPPSKDFETYMHAFIQSHTTQQEGRVDVMAKYCLRRLGSISKKGPRGKSPSVAEIETASDAAFNPSTFGESLDAIIRLQERRYPHQKIPIILPFLADGILALGGTKSEGIFRVPGDNDSVSSLKLRIDKGYYTLDGVDDPNVLASLMKLWLRELSDPLVPDELYNECVQNSKDPEACIQIVERLPTINRRVVLFVISFLQIFLEERTQTITKMTPANLALVMAPNLLRCNSDSVSVVFTNAQYEQIFVYNLLLHLHCDDIDPHYKPAHGLGAVNTTPVPKKVKNRSRRPDQ